MGPSPHVSWDELACWDRRRSPWRVIAPYPLAWRTTRAVNLTREFEAVRALCGNRPILILSAYRTQEYNASIRGAEKSQHIEGRALDLAPPPGLTIKEFYQLIVSCAHAGTSLIRGIGRYDAFVHIDIRPTKRLVLWDNRTHL